MSKTIKQVAQFAAASAAPAAAQAVAVPVYSTKEMVALGMIAASPFAVDGEVPALFLASQYDPAVQASVPGVIAALNKKGLVLSKLVKGGVRVLSLTAAGKEVAALLG